MVPSSLLRSFRDLDLIRSHVGTRPADQINGSQWRQRRQKQQQQQQQQHQHQPPPPSPPTASPCKVGSMLPLQVFQEDLATHPDNGRSLRGLVKALDAQQRSDEAQVPLMFRQQDEVLISLSYMPVRPHPQCATTQW